MYAAHGWEPTVRDGIRYAEFRACPTPDRRRGTCYEVTRETIFRPMSTAEPFGATRFRF